jgi:two-component system OmpR family response regulator
MKEKIAKIYLVEDDPLISKMITIQLELFQFEIFPFSSIADILNSNSLNEADLFIIDWMLPDGEGPDLVKSINKETEAPILMLTAKAQVIDKLVAFDAGIDDYLCKPFDMMELIARVKALLRRREKGRASDTTLQYKDFHLNTLKHEVLYKDTSLKLSPTEFKLMELFLSHVNVVFERDRLIELVLGYEYEGYGRTLDSHIARLRSKISAVSSGDVFIHTIHRLGYKFGELPES